VYILYTHIYSVFHTQNYYGGCFCIDHKSDVIEIVIMRRWLQSYLFQSWCCNRTCIKVYLYSQAAPLNATPNDSGGGAEWLVRTQQDQGLSLVHNLRSALGFVLRLSECSVNV